MAGALKYILSPSKLPTQALAQGDPAAQVSPAQTEPTFLTNHPPIPSF